MRSRALALVLVVGCAPAYRRTPQWDTLRKPALEISWKLQRTIGHRASSFTEGLVFVGDRLFESLGKHPRVRELDPKTGAVIRESPLPDHTIDGKDPFGEGLAAVGTTLFQLTWENQAAAAWDLESFQVQRVLRYPDEEQGWGLCFDGTILWRSTGQPHLVPMTSAFEHAGANLDVTVEGSPVDDLNELECVAGRIFANVWLTPFIVSIDPATGHVVGVLDLQPLVDMEDASGSESVLNGVAWDGRKRELYVTGKNWRHVYVLSLGGEEK